MQIKDSGRAISSCYDGQARRVALGRESGLQEGGLHTTVIVGQEGALL